MFYFIIYLLSFITLLNRYKNAKKFNLNFFANPFLYLYILSIFYIIIPASIYFTGFYQLIESDENNLNRIEFYSIYYFLIFWFSYLFSKDPVHNKLPFVTSKLNILGVKILRFILFLFSLFLFLIIFIKTNGINSSDSRNVKYDIYSSILNIPSFTFLSWFLIIWTLFLSIIKKRIIYLLLLTPLIYLELICSSRYYIFIFIVDIFIYNFYVLKINLNIKKVFIPILILFLIGFIREPPSNVPFNLLDFYSRTFGEFLNTWSTLPLVVQNNYHFDGSLILTFLSFLIPQPFSGIIFGEKKSYTTFLSNLHELQIGLGSSIITEGYIYGNFFFFLYPFLIILVVFLINKKIYKVKIDGVIILLLLLSNFFAIFRGSGITNLATSIMIFFILYILPKEIFRYLGLFRNNPKINV